MRVGPSLIPLIITDPLTLAKQAATLDVYSEGRLELGIGAGWLVEEAQALGRPIDHRLGRFEETIEILRLGLSASIQDRCRIIGSRTGLEGRADGRWRSPPGTDAV